MARGEAGVVVMNGAEEKILSIRELEEFDKMGKQIIRKVGVLNVQELEDDLKGGEEEKEKISRIVKKWLDKVLKYNVLGGKMLRGLMVSMTYKSLMRENLTKEGMRLSFALGWVLELLQAASLVADNLMDHGETRRGKPCWHKQPSVGLTAVNDGSILEMTAFQVLKIYFNDQPYYRELYHTLHSIVRCMIFGQSLGTRTEQATENILECYTMERYDRITCYKTSYSATYMPVICGLILAGKSKESGLVSQVESIMLQIGHYFQVQDDFLDCFDVAQRTGKNGTDIQNNKCSWLFVKAVKLCEDRKEELEILRENYGRNDEICVENIKKLYEKLGLRQAYVEYEEKTYGEIFKKVKALPEDMPRKLFDVLLGKLYKRKV